MRGYRVVLLVVIVGFIGLVKSIKMEKKVASENYLTVNQAVLAKQISNDNKQIEQMKIVAQDNNNNVVKEVGKQVIVKQGDQVQNVQVVQNDAVQQQSQKGQVQSIQTAENIKQVQQIQQALQVQQTQQTQQTQQIEQIQQAQQTQHAQQVQQTLNPINNYPVNWFNTGFQGVDVGVGSEGDAYVVDRNGKLVKYRFLANVFEEIPGDKDLPTISKVDSDADGTPYVVLASGQTYYLDCYNRWIQLPGCATDIGVGRGGEVWKIGCDTRSGGYGIWKLHCQSKCKCTTERSCTRFRTNFITGGLSNDDRKCYWYRVEGGASRIDVHPDGNPWVTTDTGLVYGYDGVNWARIDGVLAKDICVSNDGMPMVVGADNLVYALHNAATSTWVSLSGSTAAAISCGPFSQPWIVDPNYNVKTAAKYNYN